MYSTYIKYKLQFGKKEPFISENNANNFIKGFKNAIKNNKNKKNNTEIELCQSGDDLRIHSLEVVIILELFVLYLAYRTFCRIPQYLCIIFVISFVLVKSINYIDIMENKNLSDTDLDKKCVDLKNGEIRSGGLWLIYDILSIVVTLLILYYGFISFFFDMEPKNCVSVKSIKKSLSLTKSNRSINSNSFKSFSISNSFKSL